MNDKQMVIQQLAQIIVDNPCDKKYNLVPLAIMLLNEQEEKYNSLVEWTAGHIVFCDKCKHFDDYNVECKLGHNPNVPYNNWFCAEGESK